MPIVISLTAFLFVWVDQSSALNWEGHEGFFGEAMPIDEFVEGIAPPIIRPKPDCRIMAAQHAENVYQQVPLPGVNCHEKIPVKLPDKHMGPAKPEVPKIE